MQQLFKWQQSIESKKGQCCIILMFEAGSNLTLAGDF